MKRLLAALAFVAPLTVNAEAPLRTIAFGSCAHEERDQPIWETIVAERPELFLFLGDNVYVDKPKRPRTVGDFPDDYRDLFAKPGFQKLRSVCPILATWDDHDFGLNDAGAEFPLKEGARHVMLTFFEEPAASPRWTRDGVYGAWTFGPEGQRVQVILLDTRWNRSPLVRDPDDKPGGRGPYRPTEDASTTLLGEYQWAGLADRLREPAELRLIGSSIQVVAEEHGWEAWCNFPHEQRRLYELIEETRAGGVVFLSGDRHHAEISCDADGSAPYTLYDFTSSGLNDPLGTPDEPNRYRVSPIYKGAHFGLIRIDWDASPVQVGLSAVGLGGETLFERTVAGDEIGLTP